MEQKNGYLVQEMNKKFSDQHADTYEQYVLVQSGTLSKIYGENPDGDDSAARMDGLVKVSVGGGCGKRVYRRVRAMATEGLDGESIQIAVRTRNLLGVKPADTVKMRKANRIAFQWNHPEPTDRISFRLTVIIACISCLLAIISIILSL